MLDMKQEMNRIILFFTIKHKGNGEKIYSSIKNKDPVTLAQIQSLTSKYKNDYISIIDQNYPNNYKEIYMPPMSVFTIGNKKLLARDDEIVSIGELDDYKKLESEGFSKKHAYALFFDEKQIDAINYLTENDYRLILIGKHNAKSEQVNKLNINDNVVYTSEIPFEVDSADVNDEQTDERNLLGIGQMAVTFNSSKASLDRIIKIFQFEERKVRVYADTIDEQYLHHPLVVKY